MPAPEQSHRNQWAVLWPAVGVDNYGQPVVGDPVEVRVQWSTARREVVQANGSTVALDGTAIVDRVVPVGSHMWLGRLDDFPPDGDTELMETKSFDSTPDIKGRFSFKTVGLMRLHNPGAN